MVRITNQHLHETMLDLKGDFREMKDDFKDIKDDVKENTQFRQRVIGIVVGVGATFTVLFNAGIWLFKYLKTLMTSS